MDITRSDIAAALASGMKTIFMQELTQVPALWPMFATPVTSNKKSEDYGWLGQIAMPQLFTDERAPRGLTEQSFSVTNLKWENTIPVEKDALEDEQYGFLDIRVRDLAGKGVQHIDKTIAEAFEDGDENTCYDGQNFFDTDHVDVGAEYTTVQSNKLSLAFSEPNLRTAVTTMRKNVDDRGIRVGTSPSLILSGPDLAFDIAAVLKSTQKPGSSNNDYNVIQDVGLQQVVVPWFRDATRWIIADTRGVIKPMLWQLRKGPDFSALIPKGEMETEESFMRDRLLFGTRLRGAVVYGNWRLALCSDPSY